MCSDCKNTVKFTYATGTRKINGGTLPCDEQGEMRVPSKRPEALTATCCPNLSFCLRYTCC